MILSSTSLPFLLAFTYLVTFLLSRTTHAAYLTNHEIKSKASELMSTPDQLLQLYSEHKAAQAAGMQSALDHLLNSIHVDTLISHPANHSTRHVLQILTDDQVSLHSTKLLLTDT